MLILNVICALYLQGYKERQTTLWDSFTYILKQLLIYSRC